VSAADAAVVTSITAACTPSSDQAFINLYMPRSSYAGRRCLEHCRDRIALWRGGLAVRPMQQHRHIGAAHDLIGYTAQK
jgi:hypothetical protein